MNVARPLLITAVPNAVVPSLNVTLPEATAGVTVAVSVTACPNADGFGDPDSMAVVDVGLTVCANAAETLVASLVSPPYAAVSE